ncbi:MAG TPA: hypothetical protein VK689_19590 [Armatimonadota bacterium]|nr:hypothetical protein [Armatimonadota bacterium]
MSTDNQTRQDGATRGAHKTKLPYSKPELTVHGPARDLTENLGVGATDGGETGSTG